MLGTSKWGSFRWGGTTATGDIPNPSFEIPRDDGAPGQAASWTIITIDAAQELAIFEGSELPYEAFESGWGGGNQLSLAAFTDDDLEAATFNGDIATVETFDYEWLIPNVIGIVTFSGTTAPVNGSFVPYQMYRDKNTHGRAQCRQLIGSTQARFSQVDWLNSDIDENIGGFASATGVALYALNYGRELEAGNGSTWHYLWDLAPSEAIHESTLSITVVIAGAAVVITDDGSGNLECETSGILKPTGTNSIDYAARQIDISFVTPPDDGSEIEIVYEYGDIVNDPGDNALTISVAFSEESVPPYSHGSLFTYGADDLELMDVAGSEGPETFESGWDDNENAIEEYATSDLTAAGSAEDFESGWDDNENSINSYWPSDTVLAAATFGLFEYEGFETDWDAI